MVAKLSLFSVSLKLRNSKVYTRGGSSGTIDCNCSLSTKTELHKIIQNTKFMFLFPSIVSVLKFLISAIFSNYIAPLLCESDGLLFLSTLDSNIRGIIKGIVCVCVSGF